MAPRDKAGEVAVLDLIMAEMAEQATWTTSIPAWHPRNEGDDSGSGDGDGDGGGDTGGTGDDDGSGAGDKDGQKGGDKDAAQAAVDAAYAKLREAEKERDRLAAEVRKRDRAGMEETERLKAEAEDARNEAAALQEKLDQIEWKGTVEDIAKGLNFKKPSYATRFVETTTTDPKAIKKELEAAIKDIPELAGSATPPPPVNDDVKNNTGSENDRMNNALRAAAGRGTVRA